MSLSDELRGVAEAIGELLAQHIRLARLEFEADTDVMGERLGKLFALSLVALTGYAFTCGAVAFALAQVTSWVVALGTVGLVNLVVGGVGVMNGVKAMGRRDVLQETLTSGSHSAENSPITPNLERS